MHSMDTSYEVVLLLLATSYSSVHTVLYIYIYNIIICILLLLLLLFNRLPGSRLALPAIDDSTTVSRVGASGTLEYA